MLKKRVFQWFTSYLALVFALPLAPLIGASNQVKKGEMAGYLLVPHDQVPEPYNADFSIYVATVLNQSKNRLTPNPRSVDAS